MGCGSRREERHGFRDGGTTQIVIVTRPGTLGAEKGALYFKDLEEGLRRRIPSRTSDAIILTARANITSGALDVAGRTGILVVYAPRLRPLLLTLPVRSPYIGAVHIAQFRAFMERRLEVAKAIESYGFAHATERNSRIPLDSIAEAAGRALEDATTIRQVLGVEGQFYLEFYRVMDEVLPRWLKIGERRPHPPRNRGNAVVSYANSLLYSVLLAVISASGLNSSVSFIHEPNHGSIALALDVAEMYRPVVLPRALLSALGKYHLTPGDFERARNGVYLSSEGRKKVARAFMDQIHRIVLTDIGRRELLTVIRSNVLSLRRAFLDRTPPRFIHFRVR